MPWKLATFYKMVDDFKSHDWTSVSNAVWTMKGFFEDHILNQNEKVAIFWSSPVLRNNC